MLLTPTATEPQQQQLCLYIHAPAHSCCMQFNNDCISRTPEATASPVAVVIVICAVVDTSQPPHHTHSLDFSDPNLSHRCVAEAAGRVPCVCIFVTVATFVCVWHANACVYFIIKLCDIPQHTRAAKQRTGWRQWRPANTYTLCSPFCGAKPHTPHIYDMCQQ